MVGCTNEKGVPHGPSRIIVGNVVVDSCNYINGHEDGVCTSRYLTGELKRVMEFKNGVLHGETKSWYKSGIASLQAFHENGAAVGTWKKWNENGSLINIVKH